MSAPLWKTNWTQTQRHFDAWWDHRGPVLGAWGTGLAMPSGVRAHTDEGAPPPPESIALQHTDPQYIAGNVRYKMAHRVWPADILPAAWPHVGTLPLATYLGARPEYAPNNVWYSPCMSDLHNHPPLRFDPDHPECRQLERIVRETVRAADGNYFVGMPALLGGIDILAELRGTAETLMDMVDDPGAVHRRLDEIQSAYEQAFERMHRIIALPDGSMCFGYFMLWGRGKVGLCQCDTAAMFSPQMFDEFVMPYLRRQCAFLDRSMFHIDGAQSLVHLDLLLTIDGLDAIEFTPDPKSPGGGDPSWYPLYRRILDAGKSVWVANLVQSQVLPLFDAIGGRGVYASVNGLSPAQAEDLALRVEAYA